MREVGNKTDTEQGKDPNRGQEEMSEPGCSAAPHRALIKGRSARQRRQP